MGRRAERGAMKFIVQIPCYNEEATLPQTVAITGRLRMTEIEAVIFAAILLIGERPRESETERVGT